jgi:hypothetical protein
MWAHTHTHTHTHTHKHIHTYACVYIYIGPQLAWGRRGGFQYHDVCMHVYTIYTYIYTCKIRTYIHSIYYVHTYIHAKYIHTQYILDLDLLGEGEGAHGRAGHPFVKVADRHWHHLHSRFHGLCVCVCVCMCVYVCVCVCASACVSVCRCVVAD